MLEIGFLGLVAVGIAVLALKYKNLVLAQLGGRSAHAQLIAFCKANDLRIPEDAMLKRHFLTQIQNELNSSRI